jgi:hypothetical protein
MQNKTRTTFVVICSLVMAVVLCAEVKKGYYSPSQLGVLRQASPIEPLPDASFQVSAYPAPPVDLAPGDGMQDVQIYCNTCHGTRYITMQPPLPAVTWEAEVNKMTKTLGAPIPEDSAKKIVLYLQAHYTPETRKQ